MLGKISKEGHRYLRNLFAAGALTALLARRSASKSWIADRDCGSAQKPPT